MVFKGLKCILCCMTAEYLGCFAGRVYCEQPLMWWLTHSGAVLTRGDKLRPPVWVLGLGCVSWPPPSEVGRWNSIFTDKIQYSFSRIFECSKYLQKWQMQTLKIQLKWVQNVSKSYRFQSWGKVINMKPCGNVTIQKLWREKVSAYKVWNVSNSVKNEIELNLTRARLHCSSDPRH